MAAEDRHIEWVIPFFQESGERTVASPQQAYLAKQLRTDQNLWQPQLRFSLAGGIDVERLFWATLASVNANPSLRQFLDKQDLSVISPMSYLDRNQVGAVGISAQSACAALYKEPTVNGYEMLLRPHPGSLDEIGFIRTLREICQRYRTQSFAVETASNGQHPVNNYFVDLLREGPEGLAYWNQLMQRSLARPKRIFTQVTPSTGRSAIETKVILALLKEDLIYQEPDELRAAFVNIWRILLRMIAPEEDFFLLYSSGVARHLPDEIGLLGRFVPVYAIVAYNSLGHTDVYQNIKKLQDIDKMSDFFPCGDISEAGSRFGLSFVSVDEDLVLAGNRLVVTKLSAPLQALDLSLSIQSFGNVVTVSINYNSDFFTGEQIVSVEDILIKTIDRIRKSVAHFDHPKLSLTHGETSKNEGFGGLYDAFSKQSEIHKSQIAVSDGEMALSYQQLRSFAQNIDASLRKAGVVPGDCVAILMDQRSSMLAALLGVIRCGAYFLPIDARLPPSRISALLEQASPAAIIHDRDKAGLIEEFDLFSTVAIEDVSFDPIEKTDAQKRQRAESDLTYLIYTSGSMGTPKGVAVNDASLMNYLRWAADRYCIEDGCGAVVFTSASFDMSITSLFVPLLAGRTVFFLPIDDFEYLAEFLKHTPKLSFLKLTPSAVELLCALMPATEIARATNHLVLGGEQLTAQALKNFSDQENLLVTNEYGPCETTVGCTAYTFKCSETFSGTIPIGVPISNSSVGIVHANGNLAPVGFTGEIVVGGVGVAAGYQNSPVDTEAHFRSIPELGGGRWYFTGDFGYLRHDGDLIYRGRIDEQTKINGYRVETDEVASVLSRCPLVGSAKVVVRTSPATSKKTLHAFVKPADLDSWPDVSDIHEWCDRHLPSFARPDQIDFVKRYPLARSGKIDQDGLIEQSTKAAPRRNELKANANNTEFVLGEIWRDLLGRAPGSHDESFFAAGGDSIKALKFVVAARARNIHLSIADLLNKRRFGGILKSAAALGPKSDKFRRKVGSVSLTAEQRAYLELGTGGENNWSLFWMFPVGSKTDTDRLARAAAAVRRHHPALRSAFRNRSGEWYCEISESNDIAPIETFRVEKQSDQAVRREISAYLRKIESNLDLATGNVSNLCLIEIDSHETSYLVWTAHHIVCDVLSLQIMERDLLDFYRQGDAHEPVLDNYFGYVAREEGDRAITFSKQSHPRSPQQLSIAHSLEMSAGITASRVRALRRGSTIIMASLLRSFGKVDGFAELRTVCFERQRRVSNAAGDKLINTVGWLTQYQSIDATRADRCSDTQLIEELHLELMEDAPTADAAEPAPVAVNFLGDINVQNEKFLPAQLSLDANEQNAKPLFFSLEIVMWIDDGQLCSAWRYDENKFSTETVRKLASQFEAEWASISKLGETPSPTLADFADSGLSNDDLQRVLSDFQQ